MSLLEHPSKIESPPPPVERDTTEQRLRDKLRRELGPLVCGLLNDPTVIEIMLNPDGRLWVERLGHDMAPVGTMSASKAEAVMSTVATMLKTNINRENPILECELPIDGSRFEALIPPVVSGPTFTIRKKALKIHTLAEYVESGIMTERQHEVILEAVRTRKNIFVVGGTGTGKTTLTNAIIAAIVDATPGHRIAIIEDTGELQCSAPNAVTMRAVDNIDMTRLLKATMRLRPDRILVGEVRDGAALALLKAWNTGHPGGAATAHSNTNSATAGLIRLEQLVSEATAADMRQLIAEAVDLVVSIDKAEGGRRVIREVLSVTGYDGQNYVTQSL